MSEETRRILTMLSEGDISVEEAERLLAEVRSGPKPKYIRVVVNDGNRRVNVRAPIRLIRAAVKFGALIPEKVRADIERHFSEHGIELDLKGISSEGIDAFVEHLGELTVEIDQEGERTVRVSCE